MKPRILSLILLGSCVVCSLAMTSLASAYSPPGQADGRAIRAAVKQYLKKGMIGEASRIKVSEVEIKADSGGAVRFATATVKATTGPTASPSHSEVAEVALISMQAGTWSVYDVDTDTGVGCQPPDTLFRLTRYQSDPRPAYAKVIRDLGYKDLYNAGGRCDPMRAELPASPQDARAIEAALHHSLDRTLPTGWRFSAAGIFVNAVTVHNAGVEFGPEVFAIAQLNYVGNNDRSFSQQTALVNTVTANGSWKVYAVGQTKDLCRRGYLFPQLASAYGIQC